MGWVVRLNEPNVGSDLMTRLVTWSTVGTWWPNLHNHPWAGSSVVKCMLYCQRRRSRVRICQKNKCFFALNWIKLDYSGAHLDYMWSPARVLRDWIRSPGKVSILMESTRILWWCTMAATLREVQMDSRKTPDGLQVDSWYSFRSLPGLLMESIWIRGSVSGPCFNQSLDVIYTTKQSNRW